MIAHLYLQQPPQHSLIHYTSWRWHVDKRLIVFLFFSFVFVLSFFLSTIHCTIHSARSFIPSFFVQLPAATSSSTTAGAFHRYRRNSFFPFFRFLSHDVSLGLCFFSFIFFLFSYWYLLFLIAYRVIACTVRSVCAYGAYIRFRVQIESGVYCLLILCFFFCIIPSFTRPPIGTRIDEQQD